MEEEEKKEKEKKNDDARSRRYESRRETDEDERKGVKRQPVRSTRAPTYHEENESSEEEEKKAPLKKRKTSTRAKATETKSAKDVELKFEKISPEDALLLIKDLFLSFYDKKVLKSEEAGWVKEFKRQCRSIIAVFLFCLLDISGFPLSIPQFNSLSASSSFFSQIASW